MEGLTKKEKELILMALRYYVYFAPTCEEDIKDKEIIKKAIKKLNW